MYYFGHVSTPAAPLQRYYQQGVSGTVSGSRTVIDHKQLYRQPVLGSTTLQPSYPNPTCLRQTPKKPTSCGSCGRQNMIFHELHTWGNSPKLSVQLLAQQQHQQHFHKVQYRYKEINTEMSKGHTIRKKPKSRQQCFTSESKCCTMMIYTVSLIVHCKPYSVKTISRT